VLIFGSNSQRSKLLGIRNVQKTILPCKYLFTVSLYCSGCKYSVQWAMDSRIHVGIWHADCLL